MKFFRRTARYTFFWPQEEHWKNWQ